MATTLSTILDEIVNVLENLAPSGSPNFSHLNDGFYATTDQPYMATDRGFNLTISDGGVRDEYNMSNIREMEVDILLTIAYQIKNRNIIREQRIATDFELITKTFSDQTKWGSARDIIIMGFSIQHGYEMQEDFDYLNINLKIHYDLEI